MKVIYHLKPEGPSSPYLGVKIFIKNPHKTGQILAMPMWAPGSYKNRYFPGCVIDVQAYSVDEATGLQSQSLGALNVKKIRENEWQIEDSGDAVVFSYRVCCEDRSVRGAFIGREYAMFNMPSILMDVVGETDGGVEVVIDKGHYQRILTDMPKHQGASYQAESFRTLLEHPVFLLNHTYSQSFTTSNGVTHQLHVFGAKALFENFCLDTLTNVCKTICNAHIRLFGPEPLAKPYTFYLMVTKNGYGGLEHPTNSLCVTGQKSLPQLGQTDYPEEYWDLVTLLAHELFHNPWVTKLKPQAFMDFKFDSIPDTTLLWLFEGATRYYEMRLCFELFPNAQVFLNQLAKVVTGYLKWSGRHVETLAEGAQNASVKFYQNWPSLKNNTIHYYTHGCLFVMWLDKEMRQRTNNKKSFDDVVKQLWQRFYHTGQPIYQCNDVKLLIEEHLGGNNDFDDIFEHGLRSTKAIPLERIFEYFGIEYLLRHRRDLNDRGGAYIVETDMSIDIGIDISAHTNGVQVIWVDATSLAAKAGLRVGDVITKLGDSKEKLTKDNFVMQLNAEHDGSHLLMMISDEDEITRSIKINIGKTPFNCCELSVDARSNNHHNRDAWMTI